MCCRAIKTIIIGVAVIAYQSLYTVCMSSCLKLIDQKVVSNLLDLLKCFMLEGDNVGTVHFRLLQERDSNLWRSTHCMIASSQKLNILKTFCLY